MSAMVARLITTTETVNTAIALPTDADVSVRRKILVVSSPRKRERLRAKRTPRVFTLMPPPVEPEAAPINIKKMLNKRVTLAILLKSRVLKPAVLVVTDWKKEDISFVGTERPTMELRHSKMINPRVPVKSKMKLRERTNLECTERRRTWRGFFGLKKSLFNSTRTKKPRPPVMIRLHTVRFTKGSFLKFMKLSENSEKPALQNALIAWKTE
jgi:hypothetical protein